MNAVAVAAAIARLDREGCTIEYSDIPGLYVVNGTELTTNQLIGLDSSKLPRPPMEIKSPVSK